MAQPRDGAFTVASPAIGIRLSMAAAVVDGGWGYAGSGR
jgi:hypothetical protein